METVSPVVWPALIGACDHASNSATLTAAAPEYSTRVVLISLLLALG